MTDPSMIREIRIAFLRNLFNAKVRKEFKHEFTEKPPAVK